MTNSIQQVNRKKAFLDVLQAKQAVKIIAGIANKNIDNVLDVVNAATVSNAHAVDVAADTAIVSAVRKATNLFVLASAVEVEPLLAAVTAGADGVEVGNYDALYDAGVYIEAHQVLVVAQELVAQLKGQALISVTIPGHLSDDAQNEMAVKLEAMGVDMIQTEGAVRLLTGKATADISVEEKAAITLANTKRLASVVSIPVMAATGISATNAGLAFEAGASAIGVGSTVNKLQTASDMVNAVADVITNSVSAKHAVAV